MASMTWRGPGRYCSPRHRMPFNSRIEGAKCVSMTGRAMGSADIARHVIGTPFNSRHEGSQCVFLLLRAMSAWPKAEVGPLVSSLKASSAEVRSAAELLLTEIPAAVASFAASGGGGGGGMVGRCRLTAG